MVVTAFTLNKQSQVNIRIFTGKSYENVLGYTKNMHVEKVYIKRSIENLGMFEERHPLSVSFMQEMKD